MRYLGGFHHFRARHLLWMEYCRVYLGFQVHWSLGCRYGNYTEQCLLEVYVLIVLDGVVGLFRSCETVKGVWDLVFSTRVVQNLEVKR